MKLKLLNSSSEQSIIFKIAKTTDELYQSYALVYKKYFENNYCKESPEKLYFSFSHLLPSTTVIVVKMQDTVLGTVTVVNEYSKVRIKNMAMDADSYSRALILNLLKYTQHYIKKHLNMNDIIIECSKKHKRFFHSLFGFKLSNFYKLKDSNFVELTVNLEDCYDHVAMEFGKSKSQFNLFKFIFKSKLTENFDFPKRTYFSAQDPVLTPEIFNKLFNDHTNYLSKLSDDKINLLNHIYDNVEYQKLLPSIKDNVHYLNLRRGKRFQVYCPALILNDSKNIKAYITNVSPNGFCAKLEVECLLEKHQLLDINIQIGELDMSTIKAVIAWKKSPTEYGFSLIKSSSNWKNYLNYLNNQLNQALKVYEESDEGEVS